MILSVALCTYNGEQYIREQLESILNQTMPVDEIVVCDDGSTDKTLQIIEEYREKTAADIRIYCNENNLGVVANFQKAINLCCGDIIFLSDQDDVWHPDKIERIVDYFEHNKEILVVFTDGMLIDNDGAIIKSKKLWECVGMTKTAQSYIATGLGIELFANANRATGATMAIKSSFPYINSFQKYCSESILHDYAISLLALGNMQLGVVPECLIDYRIHGEQQVGVGEYLTKPLDDSVFRTSYDTVMLERLNYPEPVASRIAFIIFRDRSQHKALGLFRIIGALGRYRKMYGRRGRELFLNDIGLWIQNMWHRVF